MTFCKIVRLTLKSRSANFTRLPHSIRLFRVERWYYSLSKKQKAEEGAHY
ncbi:hypothetical protein [Rubritalea tangerina]